MSIFASLNQITAYIDTHLDSEISYAKLAHIMGTNSQTCQRIFSAMTGSSLADYIRKRRLSTAASELLLEKRKIIDVALKYGYDNASSFARAFKKFHGVAPSEVSSSKNVRDFPRIVFEEPAIFSRSIDYSVVDIPRLKLCGLKVATSNRTISRDAPELFHTLFKKYPDLPHPDYGLITYDTPRHNNCLHYYVLYDKKSFPGALPAEFEEISIPSFKGLKLTTSSQYSKDIQDTSAEFYNQFLPSSKYSTNTTFELEYYHHGITELLCPIC